MLSVANVRTAGGAANYFAADNYYTRADAERSGEWLGKGAEKLGLGGRVEAKEFEAVLKGFLPDGSRVGSDNRVHRAGTDLTFSMPKSWSILALVGGDKRILDAYAAAVRETLNWAEKNLAETRMEVKGKERVVSTGNLVIGLFQHDTNRNQEPNAHFHAVVANVTEGPDGKWRALRNDKLWEHNTLLNAITMARFRLSVEKLGYEVGEYGKHGNFEAVGVPKTIREAFSTRRAEILAAIAQMDHRGPHATDTATLMTRADKARIEDRSALTRQWGETASQLGFDAKAVIERSNARAAKDIGNVPGFSGAVRDLVDHGRALASAFAERLGLRQGDPLVPTNMGNRDAEQVAAVHAVASAIRHLGEREAAFSRTEIYRTALGFALPTSIAEIEHRVDQLLRQGQLLKGKGADRALVTTRDAIGLEQRIITAVESGRGAAPPIMPADVAGDRLQALSQLKYGMTLNPGQEAAGRLLLGSHNRIVAIQGVAGAGKTTVLKPVADILAEQGRAVLGLAVQNTLVQMLERDTGIPSMTVSRFLRQHSELLEGGKPAKLAEARAALRGTVVLLDEASMVGNADKEKLVRLANVLELGRFASIGDKKQLGAVDAGKPFDVMQQAGVETAIMNVNVRARDKALRDAQFAAQGGHIEEALRHLGPQVVEVANGAAIAAAADWLGRSPDEREKTSIYASGRELRSQVNEAVQTGLKANGELGTASLRVNTLSRVNVTREELRYARTYAPGMVVSVERRQRGQGLLAGQYRIAETDIARERVTLENERGRRFEFRPGQLRPQGEMDPLRLFEVKPLDLYAGDRIRWTETDHKRGLLNADQASIVAIDAKQVTVKTSLGAEHQLQHGDPMLERLDLAYALNAHMAQGLTSDRGIAVMDSRERNLSNQQTFLVTITRLRDGLTLYVDNAAKLGVAVERNPGMKRSALETVDLLRDAAAKGQAKGREAIPSREPPELDRALVKPFEIGI
ncbi:conjugative relaxase-like TrwC/TraI family protein [Novosphingobium kunmingense]|uniref:Conjugative relaxase-like TrwC/TraI family protein n=1 Tax=Novosphingobium kunmingense TaxID=1211806 RepID=A0A2N0I288_9SPHN|nr:MobF family relaxase [Novosphingobium kunmingense]PKB25306.1 conjugative relaxase-like TrwC/TraI family protein [Novosphingobium kunmingense]